MSVTISMPEPYTDAERDEIIASEAATIAELHGKLAFLKSKGLTVGKLKDQNGENWSYAIEHHSELCDLKTMDKLMDAEKKCDELRERAEKAEAERDELLASHQKVVGQHNGLVLAGDSLLAKAGQYRIERDAARDALRSLASYVGNGGYNADAVDPKQFEEKIREGIDTLLRVERERREKAERERDDFQIVLNSGLFEFKKRMMAERDAALARVAEMENKISPAR